VTFQILRLNDSIKMEEQFESTNYSMFTQRFENSANLFENTQSHTVLRLYYVGAPCPLAVFIFSESLSLQRSKKVEKVEKRTQNISTNSTRQTRAIKQLTSFSAVCEKTIERKHNFLYHSIFVPIYSQQSF